MENGDKDELLLTPEDHRFIEALGLHFEKQAGFPRIGGRMLGLLMLAPKPLALGRAAGQRPERAQFRRRQPPAASM